MECYRDDGIGQENSSKTSLFATGNRARQQEMQSKKEDEAKKGQSEGEAIKKDGARLGHGNHFRY